VSRNKLWIVSRWFFGKASPQLAAVRLYAEIQKNEQMPKS
jgi:hypothetical protein